MNIRILVILLFLGGLAWWIFATPSVTSLDLPTSEAAAERGEYLVAAGGCISCHEGEGGSLSGGLALDSDFGTFYAPNITPDVETGIGGWVGRDFLLALKHGRSPGGGFYYPAFPYQSYAGMTDEDVLAIGTYLLAQPAVRSEAPANELPGWLFRWTIAGWNLLDSMLNGELPESEDPVIARGAYLARHMGHCGECHTPRNALGIVDQAREFAGGVIDGKDVGAIDAQALDGWSEDAFALFLTLGLKPDGDFVGGKMEPVIEHNTSRLSAEDRAAMVAFFVRGQE
jgi:mono/diheme cytochrome c family protein